MGSILQETPQGMPTMDSTAKRSIRVNVTHDVESGQWFAWSDEIGGITAKGRSEEEALNKFRQALSYYLLNHFGCGLASNY